MGGSQSEFKEVILEQAKSIEHLESKPADLRLMFQVYDVSHLSPTEALVE